MPLAPLRAWVSRVRAQRGNRGAGPDHGRAARRPSRAGSPRPPPGRSRRGLDLRQSGAIRAARGFRQLSANLGRRHRGAGTALKVDAIWAPNIATMYPDGFATRIVPGGPALAGLEDKFRPHFFGGVCTVVAKLLLQVAPGLRDLRREGLPATQGRDRDGPRPRYSDEDHRPPDGARKGRPRDVVAQRLPLGGRARDRADALSRAARNVPHSSRPAQSLAATLGEGEAEIERAGFSVDYLEARHAETLAQIAGDRRMARCGCWWPQSSAAPG